MNVHSVCLCAAAGTITGDVKVSGFPKDQSTFARVMGYVEQSDIHSPHVRTDSHSLDGTIFDLGSSLRCCK